MQSGRSVLLILFLLAGSLSPPSLRAQSARSDPPAETGQEFYLEQNYPNPVNPETWIPFYLEDSLFLSGDSVVVTLRIHNILSQVVAIPEVAQPALPTRTRIINLPFHDPGRKVAYWDGKDSAGRRVPSGIYYCQLVVNGQPRAAAMKMVVYNPRRRSLFPWWK